MRPIISKARYEELKATYSRFKAWLESLHPVRAHRSEDVPDDCRISNDERGELELYEWYTDPPKRYMLYINDEERVATTWTGLLLGRVFINRPHLFNGVAVYPIKVYGTNGVNYYGKYCPASGDFAQIKAYKEGDA